MNAQFVTKLTDEQQEDLKAEARSTMFFILRSAFNTRLRAGGVRAKDLAEALGKDEGYVSRTLNGTARSITLETLSVFLEALGYSLQMKAIPYDALNRLKANFDARPTAETRPPSAPSILKNTPAVKTSGPFSRTALKSSKLERSI